MHKPRLSIAGVPRLLLALGLSGLGSSCSSDGSAEPIDSDRALDGALPDNVQIMTKVYAPEVSTPRDFYLDPRTDAAQSYTIHHIKNTDLGATTATPFELCASDLTVALDWSQIDATGRPAAGDIVTTAENEMYYELVRPLTDLPDWVSYGRVFKCSFVDRSGADARSASGPAGRLTKQPVTAADLKQVSEYFWSFSPFNNPGNAVLQGDAFAAGDELGYTLTLATLRPNGGTIAGCDAVDVSDWEFTARSNDGQMEWTLRPLFTFESRSDAGVAQLCTNP